MKILHNFLESLTNTSKLLKRVLAKGGITIARLDGTGARPKSRVSGSARGRIRIAENFDTPLPEDVVQDFEG